MKCQFLFSGKNTVNLSSAEFVHSVLCVKADIESIQENIVKNIQMTFYLKQHETSCIGTR